MKKFVALIGLVALVAAFAVAVAEPIQKESMKFWTNDTLATGTSADTVISFQFNAKECTWLGAEVLLDVTTGGSSGAGAIYIQGRVDTRAWENIWFVNMSDSLDIINSLAVSSTADIQRYFMISVQPFELNAEGADLDDTETKIISGMNLPYTQYRLYVLDTNWNAGVKVYGTWLFKK